MSEEAHSMILETLETREYLEEFELPNVYDEKNGICLNNPKGDNVLTF